METSGAVQPVRSPGLRRLRHAPPRCTSACTGSCARQFARERGTHRARRAPGLL